MLIAWHGTASFRIAWHSVALHYAASHGAASHRTAWLRISCHALALLRLPRIAPHAVASYRTSSHRVPEHGSASLCFALLVMPWLCIVLQDVVGMTGHGRTWQDMVEVAQDVSSYCMIGLSWLFFASLHFLLFAWSRGVYPWMICGLQIWCLIGKKYSDRGRGGVFSWMICGPGLPRLPDACLGKRACRCREWAREGG